MRLHYPNLTRPKKAARRLADLRPGLSLAQSQQAIARTIGYRDWHELECQHAKQAASALDQALPSEELRERLRVLSQRLGQSLEVSIGEAQHTLSHLRLCGDRPASLGDHIAGWTKALREQLGPPARFKPGTIVKVKGMKGWTGYLCQFGQPTRILFDTSIGEVADFEVVTPRVPLPDFVPLRLWLPYGYWTLKDGSEVLFSRDYLPLWRVSAAGVERLPPWLWIDDKEDGTWFKDKDVGNWSAPHVVEAAQERLMQFGITTLPRLADVLPYLFDFGVESVAGATRRMFEAHRHEPVPTGPFHVRWPN